MSLAPRGLLWDPCRHAGHKTHRPPSRAEFDRRFLDDAARGALGRVALAGGLRVPGLRGAERLAPGGGTGLRECAGCGRQTSVAAGTAMHRSKLPLRVWFTALRIMTSHSKGISALQLRA